jgi:anti-sigma28 factor (negative regulator of flagellin synthesis)
MANTISYAFKEELSPVMSEKNRVIVKTTPVPATTQKVEFSMAQKEQELVMMEQQLVSVQKRVDDLKAEISEATEALDIKEVAPVIIK